MPAADHRDKRKGSMPEKYDEFFTVTNLRHHTMDNSVNDLLISWITQSTPLRIFQL
jgi:hypothetical protein